MTMPSFHVISRRSNQKLFFDLNVQESEDERRARLDEKI